MASRGQLQMMSCFTLLLGILLIFALSSYQAAATKEAEATTISETRRSMISWTWDNWGLPKDWFKRSLKDMLVFLNKIRKRIIDEMLKILGLPPTGDILHYSLTAVKWLGDKLYYFLSDPRARIDTVMDWIVDSVLNPFRTLTDGMRSFQRLFRYLHKLRKGSYASFGKDNPIYRCYLDFFPGCVAKSDNGVDSRIFYQFYCAWMFYERCQLNWWWVNGKWKVPNINGIDRCKLLPKGKCR